MRHSVPTAPPSVSSLGRKFRIAVGAAGVVNLAWAVAFASQQEFAVQLWPWETGPLSHLFIGSMLAAVAAASFWIAVSGEAGSLPAGLLNLAVTLGGVAGFLLLGDPDPAPATWFGVLVAVLAVGNLVAFGVARVRVTVTRDDLPLLLRASYGVFAAVLLTVGLALILRVDGVMPWPLDPDTSVVFGWIFFGDAFYFAYALVRPGWPQARSQLWSFLGYDVVLIGPLLAHLGSVDPPLRDNLIVYLAILLYSAALGVWYLLVNPRTRGWRPPARKRMSGPTSGD